MNEQHDEVKLQLSNLVDQDKGLQEECEQLMTTLSEQVQENKELTTQVETLEEENEDLKQEIIVLENNHKELIAELEKE